MGKKPKKKLSAYNRHVQREMKAGRTMKQAAASWSKKAGKPKAKTATKSSPKKRTSKPKSTGGRKRVGFNQQKLFKLVRLMAIAAPAAGIAMSTASTQNKIDGIIAAYTGFKMSDRTFNFSRLMTGYGPALGALLATYGLPKLAGIIRGL